MLGTSLFLFLLNCHVHIDTVLVYANHCNRYYGYLSSQVYSTDMFYSVFKKNPMDQKEGRRYRHTVLERGGSREEMSLLEEFLGRKPSTEAFYRELGIGK
jgi:metallopeptidase MepB